MCSRYNLTSPHEAVRDAFRYQNNEVFPPRYNIAPTQPVGVVRLDHVGNRILTLVRWGLIPSWVKDPRNFATLVNARAETVAEKSSFRGALRHKRCLVPANGFYEWTGPARARRPYHFRPRGSGLLALAGLFETWLGADGSEIDTMAILTVAANRKVAAVHDRMPAIIMPPDFDAWLDCRSGESTAAAQMLVPADDELLDAVEIDRKLNDPRNEGAALLVSVAAQLPL